MKHDLPTIRSDKAGFLSLAHLMDQSKNLINDSLELDFKYCGFFDANMAAPLQTILARIAQSNEIVISNIPHGVKTILRKNEFLCEYGFCKIDDTNHTTLPYRNFPLNDHHSFSEYLGKHLSGKGIPLMNPNLEKKFIQSIFEIFVNCATHSNSKFGIFVCGQYYPQRNLLDLTISDSGVGIRTNARRVVDPNISSTEAIKWSLVEGNTSKVGTHPGGFGLKLLQEFIELNKGKVQIISRQGYYEFSNGEKKFVKLDYDLPGTTINIEIKTNDNHIYALKDASITSNDIF